MRGKHQREKSLVGGESRELYLFPHPFKAATQKVSEQKGDGVFPGDYISRCDLKV